MNRNRLFTAICLPALLLAAGGCTQDDDFGGNTLPQGKYPLEIASVTLSAEVTDEPWGASHAPQTRVSENSDGNSSHWDNGDKIKVQIADGTPGTYTYQDGNLTVAEGDAPAYWASKDSAQSIRAWHTSSGSETVELNKQTAGLAYVLTAQTTADFNTPVSLPFSHALAKVRVVLQGSGKDKVTDVKIKTYTGCTLNADGTLTAGDMEDYISMVPVLVSIGSDETAYWEANVVPNKEIKPVKIILNGGSELLTDLTTPVTPEAGKWHEITIEVKEQGKEINLSEGDYTITDDGKYILRGSYTNALIIQGSPTVTLNDANITRNNGAIIVESGNPTFTLEGGNTLSNATKQSTSPQQWSPPFAILGKETNVTIQGNGTLVVDATKNTQTCLCAIGSCNKEGGNINILGGTIKAYATSATAIGVSCGGSFGNITIENATVEVRGWPAIGSSNGGMASSNSTCGNILIENSTLSASTSGGWSSSPAIGAGGGDDGSQMHCGTITITNTSMIRSQILSAITGKNVKIGKGNISNGSANSCGLITITGSDGTQTYSGDTGVTK